MDELTQEALEDVLEWAKVVDVTLEQIIDTQQVEMWVRVVHDKFHGAILFADRQSLEESA